MKKIRQTVQSLLPLHALWLLLGCSPSWQPDTTQLQQDYLAAVNDARTALASEISHTLPAIVSPDKPDSELQEWMIDSEGRALILVGTLMSSADTLFYPGNRPFEMGEQMPWVTLPYDLSEHLLRRLPQCTDSAECRMRLVQLLGLPPTCSYDCLTFFYAEASRLFRPTPDPEVDDHEAQLDFPDTAPEHYRKWFKQNSEGSYNSDSPYPWTRLGYTYDWHRGTESVVGPGEFIVHTGAHVQVVRKVDVWSWYQAEKATLKKITKRMP